MDIVEIIQENWLLYNGLMNIERYPHAVLPGSGLENLGF